MSALLITTTRLFAICFAFRYLDRPRHLTANKSASADFVAVVSVTMQNHGVMAPEGTFVLMVRSEPPSSVNLIVPATSERIRILWKLVSAATVVSVSVVVDEARQLTRKFVSANPAEVSNRTQIPSVGSALFGPEPRATPQRKRMFA